MNIRNHLRVLVLAQYFSPDMGGGSTRATNVVKGLLSKGCTVTVVTAFPHYPHGRSSGQYKHKAVVSERMGNAKVFRVWIPDLPHSSAVNRVFLHLCFIVSSLFALPFVSGIDLIWDANPNMLSIFPGIVYGTAKLAPIVQNVDDLWPEVFFELGLVKSKILRRMLNFLAWFSYAVPAAITPISEGYKRYVVAKYRISPGKVHVIEVGVDSIRPLSAAKESTDRFVAVYSGILGLGYDFDVLLEAARYLEKDEAISFVIRGVGEMAPKLEKKISQLALGNVVLKTGFQSGDELASLLSSADAFVLPMAALSFVDLGLPAKVFEYQAYGRPVICVSGGEPARYIETSRSGLVVKPRDSGGFAEAVIRLYTDRRLGYELGSNGRDYVSTHLTSEKVGERMLAVLTSVASLDHFS